MVLNTTGILSDEPALLGLMRHCLELARVHHSAEKLYQFSFDVHPAMGVVYGGAVWEVPSCTTRSQWSAMPMRPRLRFHEHVWPTGRPVRRS